MLKRSLPVAVFVCVAGCTGGGPLAANGSDQPSSAAGSPSAASSIPPSTASPASAASLNVTDGVKLTLDGQLVPLVHDYGDGMIWQISGEKTSLNVQAAINGGRINFGLTGAKDLSPGFTKADLASLRGGGSLSISGLAVGRNSISFDFLKDKFSDHLQLANTADRFVATFDGDLHSGDTARHVHLEINLPWKGKTVTAKQTASGTMVSETP